MNSGRRDTFAMLWGFVGNERVMAARSSERKRRKAEARQPPTPKRSAAPRQTSHQYKSFAVDVNSVLPPRPSAAWRGSNRSRKGNRSGRVAGSRALNLPGFDQPIQ